MTRIELKRICSIIAIILCFITLGMAITALFIF